MSSLSRIGLAAGVCLVGASAPAYAQFIDVKMVKENTVGTPPLLQTWRAVATARPAARVITG